MKPIKKESMRFINPVMYVTGLLVFSYIVYRACFLSFTIDESETFNEFVPLSFRDIISLSKKASANSHILNTLGMKLFSFLFGNSELSLRMPNVLAYLLYFYYSMKISNKMKNSFFILFLFFILNFNPYVVDFFSLARGYGLSITFMLASYYYLLVYAEANDEKYLWYMFIFSSLAVVSNFSLLVFYASLLMTVGYIDYIQRSTTPFSIKNILVKYKSVFLITIMLAAFCFRPIRRLIESEALYSGGDVGFWHDTIGSLITTYLYGSYGYGSYTYNLLVTLWYSIIFITITAAGFLVFTKKATHILKLTYIILLLPAAVSILQHYLIGSKFLINRTALFFYPLFFIFLATLLHYFYTKTHKKTATIVSGLLMLFVLVNAIKATNVRYFLSWRFEAETKEMLLDLQKISERNSNERIKLGYSWLYTATIKFYKNTLHMNWLVEETDIKGPHMGDFDYYFLKREDEKFITSNKLQVIKKYERSQSLLVK